jgi:hypothetical protein
VKQQALLILIKFYHFTEKWPSFALDEVASFALDEVASFALDEVASFAYHKFEKSLFKNNH